MRPDSQGYFGIGRSACKCGCHSDCKLPKAKFRFHFAIPPRPYRFEGGDGYRNQLADPSLPTTEEGISEPVGKNRPPIGRGGASSDKTEISKASAILKRGKSNEHQQLQQ
jgi:hypothetical protein